MRLIGAHISIAGGIEKAPVRGKDIGCDVIQIFTKNASQWSAKPLSERAIAAFCQAVEDTGIKAVAAHDSYLINLASPEEGLYQRSLAALVEEMERARALGLPYLVIHPGSHRGGGEEEGLRRIATGIDSLFAQLGDARPIILLETTAGQGTSLGYRLEQLARIIEMATSKEHIGVCLDTCHLYAAGYDIGKEAVYERFMGKFARLIGLERLGLVHLNDSQAPLGSRVDRHEHIGRGHLGLEAFRLLLQDSRFTDLPFIIETPKGRTSEGEDWDVVNMRLLRGLIDG